MKQKRSLHVSSEVAGEDGAYVKITVDSADTDKLDVNTQILWDSASLDTVITSAKVICYVFAVIYLFACLLAE